MCGHAEGGYVNIIADPDSQVLPVEENIGDDGVVPSVEESATNGKQGYIAILALEVFNIGAEDIFTERALPGGHSHRLQGQILGESDAGDEMGGVPDRQALVGGTEGLFGLVEMSSGEAQLESVCLIGGEAPKQPCAEVEIVLSGGKKIFTAAETGIVEVVLELFVPPGRCHVKKVVEESNICSDADFVPVLPSYIFDERGGQHCLCGGIAHITGFKCGDSSANAQKFLPPMVLIEGSVGADAEGEVWFGD